MLHIILGILKAVIIIIGIVLGLILCIVLAALFVPVRYRVRAVKNSGELHAEARISFLLHLFHMAVLAGKGEKLSVTIRLFGIRLPLFDEKKKRRRRKKRKKKSRRESEAKRSFGTMKEEEAVPEILKDDEMPKEPELLQDDEMPTEQECQQELLQTDEQSAEQGAWCSDEEPPEQETQQEAQLFGKIKQIFTAVRETVTAVIRLIGSFPQKAEAFGKKAAALLGKPEELLAKAEQYEIKMLLGDGWALLYSLLRHYAPRRITGHLRFGTGDPSSTGKLTGLLYMLLPVRANRFLIQPEFTEAVFETEFAASGRIRACHFAGMAWKLFRDKRLRRVIRAVRK